jgi:opacity protein-like surface antigen
MKTFRTFVWSVIPLLILLCFSSVWSQPSFRVGFQGGLAVSRLSYSKDLWQTVDQSTRRGVVVGAIGEIGLNARWSIRIEPRYIQKGNKIGAFAVTGAGGPTVLGTIEVFEKLDYLEIPLHVRATFPMEGITPFLFAGPSLGFLLTAKLDGTPAGFELTPSESGVRDIKTDFKSTDVSVDVGLGVEYHLSVPVAMLLEGAYSHGLLNIWANSQPADLRVRNTTLQFSLGMMFEI